MRHGWLLLPARLLMLERVDKCKARYGEFRGQPKHLHRREGFPSPWPPFFCFWRARTPGYLIAACTLIRGNVALTQKQPDASTPPPPPPPPPPPHTHKKKKKNAHTGRRSIPSDMAAGRWRRSSPAQGARIAYLIDVRSAPYSRFKPEFSRNALEAPAGARHPLPLHGGQLGGQPEDRACYEDGKVLYERVGEQDFFRDGIARLGSLPQGPPWS